MVFFAANQPYFSEHGIYLLRSCLRYNPDWFVHVHIYDPSPTMLREIDDLAGVSASYELLDNSFFEGVAVNIKSGSCSKDSVGLERAQRICRTIKAHERHKFCGLLAHLLSYSGQFRRLLPVGALANYFKKTYFACNRFVVLGDLLNSVVVSGHVFALDADALFNSPFPAVFPHENCDIAIRNRLLKGHQKFMAGAIFLPSAGKRNDFLAETGNALTRNFALGQLDWGLDQEILDHIVPKYKWEGLESDLFDLEFLDDSVVWVAKGNSKSDPKYCAAQLRNNGR